MADDDGPPQTVTLVWWRGLRALMIHRATLLAERSVGEARQTMIKQRRKESYQEDQCQEMARDIAGLTSTESKL